MQTALNEIAEFVISAILALLLVLLVLWARVRGERKSPHEDTTDPKL